jgi:dihydroneopterin aldolase
MAHSPDPHVIIIGAGPAGCSCASWLAQKNIACTVIERAPQTLPLLEALDLQQSWVMGFQDTSTADIAQQFRNHLQTLPLVQVVTNQGSLEFKRLSGHEKHITLQDGRTISGSALVIATGLRTRRPEPYFQPKASRQPLDATDLTRTREKISNKSVLLLGGGDNAVENALYLHHRGNRVTLWSRGELRAQQKFKQELMQYPTIQVRTQTPLPVSCNFQADQPWNIESAEFGSESFDEVAVLFGFEPDDAVWQNMVTSHAWEDQGQLPLPVEDYPQLATRGIFLAGDISQRLHPSIQTALADGVTASLQVTQWLENLQPAKVSPRYTANQPTMNNAPPNKAHGQRRLSLTGLRFDANLGILKKEKIAPQPIQVDAELCLGSHPLIPADDDIIHVLDYRNVRQIIIDECTAKHVNLLETLVGQLSNRLMQLPGVRGVRIKIAKLEIFSDCEVAIRMQTGLWSQED